MTVNVINILMGSIIVVFM